MKRRFLLALSLSPILVACGSTAASTTPDAGARPEPTAPVTVDAGGEAATTTTDAAVDPIQPMTKARSLFAAVTSKDGRVRAFGGLGRLGLMGSVEAYDVSTNTWTASTAEAPVARYGHTAAIDASDRVIVIGGTSDGKTPIDAVEAYAPATDTWSTLPALPTARLGLAAATGKDGRVYAIGGRKSDGSLSDLVEVYTPGTNAWTTAAHLPTPRMSLCAVAAGDGKIYAIGGRDANQTPLSVVEVYDVDAGTWSAGPSMSTARYWFGATLGRDGKIFAIGGIGDVGFVEDAEALTPGGTWQRLAPMPEPRAWLGAAASSDGRVFAIGGSLLADQAGQPPPERSMVAFDPTTNRWTK